jgi:hypothetical protein
MADHENRPAGSGKTNDQFDIPIGVVGMCVSCIACLLGAAFPLFRDTPLLQDYSSFIGGILAFVGLIISIIGIAKGSGRAAGSVGLLLFLLAWCINGFR